MYRWRFFFGAFFIWPKARPKDSGGTSSDLMMYGIELSKNVLQLILLELESHYARLFLFFLLRGRDMNLTVLNRAHCAASVRYLLSERKLYDCNGFSHLGYVARF